MKFSTAWLLLLLAIPLCLAKPSRSKAAAQCGVSAVKPDTSNATVPLSGANIVGGTQAIPYSWPWQVALFQNGQQFCAGTLISDQWVLTAGHCFYGETKPEGYKVKLGVYNKTDNDEQGEVVVGLSEIHVNPQYDPDKTQYDCTLLKLENPVQFTDHISPVCLPAVEQEPLPPTGTTVWITGWGDTTVLGGKDSKPLKQGDVPLEDIAACQKQYPRDDINPDVEFCAGYKQGGEGVCYGDSGGPLVYQDPTTGVWKQLGIISWGRLCAPPYSYQVYSKVAAYIDFINQYVTF